MVNVFIPYIEGKPAPIFINGHRLIILSYERDALVECMQDFGADQIEEVAVGGTPEEQEELFGSLAQTVQGGVVVAPLETRVQELIDELEAELPWLQ